MNLLRPCTVDLYKATTASGDDMEDSGSPHPLVLRGGTFTPSEGKGLAAGPQASTLALFLCWPWEKPFLHRLIMLGAHLSRTWHLDIGEEAVGTLVAVKAELCPGRSSIRI